MAQSPEFNLAVVHEAIAASIPERDCIIYRNRRYTWADFTDRSRRLAEVFRQYGLGCRRERPGLENWESGQDHIGLYLYNGNEYLEGMLGAFKARAAPFNVNYRYVDEELEYLFDNADARAIVYHAAFVPTLMRVRERLPRVELWLQVEDGSGTPLMEGAVDYEAALAAATPRVPAGLSPDDLYILYTGGTTGMPKGVLWRQDDVFRAALYPVEIRDLEGVAARAQRGGPRVLAAPPFMHGAAHWAAFTMWHVGGTVVIQSDVHRLDPVDIWRTVEREKVTSLTIVGDSFGRPLADELARGSYDVSSLRMLTSGGAILTAALKREFLDLPHERWGQQVTALVQLRHGARADEEGFREAAGEHIAAYKLPKQFFYVDQILRSPSGKADYRWARATAMAKLGDG